jgi:transposase
LDLVAENKDITLIEIAERLEADHGVKACVGTVWKFFDKRSITYKKRQRTPQNNSAPM